MTALTTYLMDTFYPQKREAAAASRLVGEVLPTFGKAWSPQKRTWPYEYTQDGPGKIEKFSFSTSAMILFSLVTVLGNVRQSVLLPFLRRAPNLSDIAGVTDDNRKDIENMVRRGTRRLVAEILKDDFATYSSTYGEDDPLTLVWCHELLRFSDNALPNISSARSKIAQISANTIKRLAEGEPSQWLKGADKDRHALDHAFLKLKAMQLCKCLASDGSKKTLIEKYSPALAQFFEERLHLQLAYDTVPDSRFDPAELAFCIEGSLLYDPGYLGTPTIERALEVLKKRQEVNPYWRPLTPFIGTQKGFTLFPVSVEVANSLIRSTTLLDGDDLLGTNVHNFIPQFRRYTNWLRARIVRRTTTEGSRFIGWHSEHLGEADRIHLWETSQVIVYLLHYSALLNERAARAALIKSGLSVERRRRKVPRHTKFKEDQLAKMSSFEYWVKCVEPDREPFLNDLGADTGYNVVRYIGERFIKPRSLAGSGDQAYTLLLSGPPGTGKTSLCQEIAATLGWHFINISVSDFLGGGAAEVEDRAKSIFEILNAQTNSVILLDEIDNFLLDRESVRYQGQQGIFQFLTPGMLTKLQSFRDQKSSILIVATNYLERIDSAIKRPGRFDARLTLLPPGLKQRQQFISGKIKNDWTRAAVTPSNQLRAIAIEMAKKTPLFSKEELSRLLDEVGLAKRKTAASLRSTGVQAIKNNKASLTLQSYATRLDRPDPTPPTEEFFLLLYLLAEAGLQDLTKEDIATVGSALKAANNGQPPAISKIGQLLTRNGINNELHKTLSKAIEKWNILGQS